MADLVEGNKKDSPNNGARYLGGWSKDRTGRRRPNPAERKGSNLNTHSEPAFPLIYSFAVMPLFH